LNFSILGSNLQKNKKNGFGVAMTTTSGGFSMFPFTSSMVANAIVHGYYLTIAAPSAVG
jgi:hypothetical protein